MNGITSQSHPSIPSRTDRFVRAFPVIVLTSMIAMQATSAYSADPFYERLRGDGEQALRSGEPAEAARLLRIAAFGMLDEPATLMGTLLLLAIAHSEAGDNEAFLNSFARIEEIERRFGSFRDLPENSTKQHFAQLASERIDTDRLQRTPAFRSFRLPAPQPEATTPRQRRRDLQASLDGSASDLSTLVTLSRLELAERKLRQAERWLEAAFALDPGHREGHCIRTEIETVRSRCGPALAAYTGCAARPERPSSAAFLLDCMLGANQISDASALAALLPQEWRRRDEIATILNQLPETPDPVESSTSNVDGTNPAPPIVEEPRASSSAQTSIAADDREVIATVKRLLETAVQPEDLNEPLRLAAQVAERNPQSQEAQYLAGEVAYRATRWRDAAFFFRRGGRPAASSPLLLFYYAVSLYESGDGQEAASAMRIALPGLVKTPFVDVYVQKILGAGG